MNRAIALCNEFLCHKKDNGRTIRFGKSIYRRFRTPSTAPATGKGLASPQKPVPHSSGVPGETLPHIRTRMHASRQKRRPCPLVPFPAAGSNCPLSAAWTGSPNEGRGRLSATITTADAWQNNNPEGQKRKKTALTRPNCRWPTGPKKRRKGIFMSLPPQNPAGNRARSGPSACRSFSGIRSRHPGSRK